MEVVKLAKEYKLIHPILSADFSDFMESFCAFKAVDYPNTAKPKYLYEWIFYVFKHVENHPDESGIVKDLFTCFDVFGIPVKSYYHSYDKE